MIGTNNSSATNRRALYEAARASVTKDVVSREFGVPGACWKGDEFWTLNPTRSDLTIGSFHIAADGRFYDHATGQGGDLIDLISLRDSISKAEAAQKMLGWASVSGSPHGETVVRKGRPRSQTPIPTRAMATLEKAVGELGLTRAYGPPAWQWTYFDAKNRPIFVVLRYERPGKKAICPLCFGEDGNWHMGQLSATDRPLYGLNRLAANPNLPVLVVEGEKCADVTVPGWILVTWSGGSCAVNRTNWAPLLNRQVHVWPDNDEPGRKAATAILQRLPHAHLLVIPDGKIEGWDIADADAEGFNILNLISQCPSAVADGLITRRISSIERAELRWLWRDRFPLGKLSILAGDPGLGKSTLVLDICARVSNGTAFPDGSVAPVGTALILSAEDDAADTIRPRLEAAGAYLDQVFVCTAVRRSRKEVPFSLVTDIEHLDTQLRNMDHPVMVVIDPVSAYLDGTDSHKNADTRAVLAPLAGLAAKHGVAILAVHHLNKGQGPAIYRLSGSLAFTAAARAVWGVARDPGATDSRLFVPIKCNLARTVKGYRFSLADGPRILWAEQVETQDADRLLELENSDDRSAREEAAEWLRDMLVGGPIPANEIKKRAQSVGISERTLRRAADGAGIQRKKTGYAEGWAWCLPETKETTLPGEDVQGVQCGETGHLPEKWPPSTEGLAVCVSLDPCTKGTLAPSTCP